MHRTVIGLFALCACVPMQSSTSVSPEASVFATKRPSILSVDATKDNQLRDGVRIIVTPTPFRAERKNSAEFRFKSAILLVGAGPGERRDRSEPTFGPDELRFKIRINNRLPRVVRLAGTAVAFQLAGRTMNVPRERYTEFLNGIVLPQQEVSFDLVGPKVSEVVGTELKGDSATLALLLYDVVTATDAAGTPTRRSNFEFYYRFSMVPVKDSIIARSCGVALSMPAYQYLQQVTQNNSNRWVKVPEWESAYACP